MSHIYKMSTYHMAPPLLQFPMMKNLHIWAGGRFLVLRILKMLIVYLINVL